MMEIMKKTSISLIALFAATLSAHAYVIDGMVDDWAVNLSAAVNRYYLNSDLPSGGLDIDYVTEDNADSTNKVWYVGPQYSLGNICDAEAMYFDNDATNIYIAIIQGLPINGAALPAGWSPSYIRPGDIALNLDGNSTYEYGLDILSSSQAVLKKNCTWATGQYSGTPYQIASGSIVNSSVAFACSTSAVNGHYVIETSIPLSALGLTAETVKTLAIHWTMSCGNDYLTLNADINPVPVPEPSTFFLMIIGAMGSLLSFGRRRYAELRRGGDIIISAFALVVSAPILLAAAIIIKIDSAGPIFYKQVRVGVNRRRRNDENDLDMACRRKDNCLGQPFTIYKLRTMRADAESKTGAVWAQQNDPRVTKVGNFLRKTRIDEIPQFINVLKGEMSIIGPRPERPVFVKQLNENIVDYDQRFDVKPGITGLAQTRYQYASTVEDTKKKLKYDLLYVKKNSFMMDISIMWNTVGTVLFARGR